MFTDLICPTCSEVVPRNKNGIKIDIHVPHADVHHCGNCDTTWYVYKIRDQSPLIVDITRKPVAVDLNDWIREQIFTRLAS